MKINNKLIIISLILGVALLFAVFISIFFVFSSSKFNSKKIKREFQSMCDNQETQLEMNFCAKTEYEKIEQELQNKLEKVRLAQSDPLFDEYSQKNWEGDRESRCQSESNYYDGGSIQPLIYYTCLSGYTKNRIEDLSLFDNKSGFMTLELYRKDPDYVYFTVFNKFQDSTPYYLRTKEKTTFDKYIEGDIVTIVYSKIEEIVPTQNYMFGVKDYSVPITKDLSGIEIFMLE